MMAPAPNCKENPLVCKRLSVFYSYLDAPPWIITLQIYDGMPGVYTGFARTLIAYYKLLGRSRGS